MPVQKPEVWGEQCRRRPNCRRKADAGFLTITALVMSSVLLMNPNPVMANVFGIFNVLENDPPPEKLIVISNVGPIMLFVSNPNAICGIANSTVNGLGPVIASRKPPVKPAPRSILKKKPVPIGVD